MTAPIVLGKAPLPEEKLPVFPSQPTIVISPFKFALGSGVCRYPPDELKRHARQLLFDLSLISRGRHSRKMLRRLGRKYPHCRVTIVQDENARVTRAILLFAQRCKVKPILVTAHPLGKLIIPSHGAISHGD